MSADSTPGQQPADFHQIVAPVQAERDAHAAYVAALHEAEAIERRFVAEAHARTIAEALHHIDATCHHGEAWLDVARANAAQLVELLGTDND